MKRTLIVIDMQNDFVDKALGTREAVAILPAVRGKIREYAEKGDEVIFTRDTHGEDYLNTPEGRALPVPHCIKGTFGWEIYEGLYIENAEIIDKPTFGYTGWGERDFECVEIIGLCTDICVVSNALIIKATFPDAKITVDSKCCAGVTPESHNAALTTMKMCQIEVL
ncbi:MAG: cysteine hydrolase [Clostridia bacterium]|nr:cysteine hydrolase [Clostridia bacterium]